MFKDVIDIYAQREPAQQDTWNPLTNESELWHRVRLLIAMQRAFQQIARPLSELRFCDVGCGVGRSSRLLLELGAKPANVLGIDLRPSAIEYARSINASLNYQVVESLGDWPPAGQFDVCLQCTVFSSLQGTERRQLVAEKMESMLKGGGYIYWWDSYETNYFAGYEALNPVEIFKVCEPIDIRHYSLYPNIIDVFGRHRTVARLFGWLLFSVRGFHPTHCSALLRKRE